MSIRNLSHVAIGVSDIEPAVAFYRDIVGMEVIFDDTEEFEAMGELAAHTRRGVYMRWKDGPDEAFIVLDHHVRKGRAEPKPFFDYGYHHYGFWVDDANAIHRRALDAGAHVVVPPGDHDAILYGERTGGKVRSCVLRDPDGNLVQFDQRLA